MLPIPTLSFTIPSVQDDLVLQCRIYHPECLHPTSVSQISGWRKRAAIIAHPYAPLGGCYDDPVVGVIGSVLLKQGFVVGTFNFRGAGTSKGRTSWQSKAEQNDYVSFIGFMVYYIHLLKPPTLPYGFVRPSHSNPELHDLSPVPSQALPPRHFHELQDLSPTNTTSPPHPPGTTLQGEAAQLKTRLLLAGYSYGALIASSLPPIISSIITPFQTPLPGTPYAEIRLRAEGLAAQQNESIDIQVNWVLETVNTHKRGRSIQTDNQLCSPKLRRANGGVRMGGEEDLRRASHESYRSRSSMNFETPDRVRKSIDRVRSLGGSHARFSPRRFNSQGSIKSNKSRKEAPDSPVEKGAVAAGEACAKLEEKPSYKEIPDITEELQTAYLLVSIPVGWVGGLATMWSTKSLGSGFKSKDSEHENDIAKLTIDPTLVLFGDDDAFISVRRFRAWAEKLHRDSVVSRRGRFRYREVSGAGHFWHDHVALSILKEEVKAFATRL